MSKKFYWLKLKEDFFNDPDIKLIKAQKDGKDFLILYLQLQLLSLRNEGILRHKDVIPYTPDMLSTLTDTPKSIVEQGIKLFINLGMIEQWDDGTLYMLEMQKLIGHESESAARVRKHRENQKLLQCNEEVTKSNTEIEREKELEKEKDIIPYADIIDYLNQVCGTKYRHGTTKTKDVIKARYNEGFKLDDFKKVIDTKYNEWNNTEHAKYLRPETLFGNKFEGYLNQLPSKPKQPIKNNKFQNFNQRENQQLPDMMAKFNAKH